MNPQSLSFLPVLDFERKAQGSHPQINSLTALHRKIISKNPEHTQDHLLRPYFLFFKSLWLLCGG
jgi:hypothetical protein